MSLIMFSRKLVGVTQNFRCFFATKVVATATVRASNRKLMPTRAALVVVRITRSFDTQIDE